MSFGAAARKRTQRNGERGQTNDRDAWHDYLTIVSLVPLDWAMTQNNLGNALLTLGQRETGTAKLEEAIVAYREALKERTRERVPLDWAMTQNNLGNALLTLGQRETGTTKLEEAIVAYREALKEQTPERVPLQWAMTQNNLGHALLLIGQPETSR
jgi:tetratricopeptide (TPR) repeat protein